MQETHFNKKGKLNAKLQDFEIFEAIRKRQKGGTLLAAHKSLDPILIEEYSEDFELLVVEIKMGGLDVRVMTGHGPQENWNKDDRMPFFMKLEEEIAKAKLHEKAIFLQMDANSKLGPGIIKGDPHQQSENGKVLAEIVRRNALVVMNSSEEKCKGKITRRRVTAKTREESIIDFVIVSDEVADMINEVEIDEERKYSLTGFIKTKKGTKTIESDHNTIITRIEAVWNKGKIKETKEEMYNLKNVEGLMKFKDITEDSFLSEVFDDPEKSVEVTTKQFLKRLGFCISQSFKKVRIKGTKRNKELEALFGKRRALRPNKDEQSKQKLKEVEHRLCEVCA